MLNAAAVRERAAELRGVTPERIVAWTVATFPERAALTVSFGGGGVVLAHMLSHVERSVPVRFLESGCHFPGTLAFKEVLAGRDGRNIIELRPHTDPGPPSSTQPIAC